MKNQGDAKKSKPKKQRNDAEGSCETLNLSYVVVLPVHHTYSDSSYELYHLQVNIKNQLLYL